MRMIWPSSNLGGYWITPAAVGMVLILVGLLIYAAPELLAYFVAAVFVVAGATLVAIAWKMRKRVTYRRLDGFWSTDDDEGER